MMAYTRKNYITSRILRTFSPDINFNYNNTIDNNNIYEIQYNIHVDKIDKKINFFVFSRIPEIKLKLILANNKKFDSILNLFVQSPKERRSFNGILVNVSYLITNITIICENIGVEKIRIDENILGFTVLNPRICYIFYSINYNIDKTKKQPIKHIHNKIKKIIKNPKRKYIVNDITKNNKLFFDQDMDIKKIIEEISNDYNLDLPLREHLLEMLENKYPKLPEYDIDYIFDMEKFNSYNLIAELNYIDDAITILKNKLLNLYEKKKETNEFIYKIIKKYIILFEKYKDLYSKFILINNRLLETKKLLHEI